MCASGKVHFFFFQAEDGIRDLVRSRGLGDVYKRQDIHAAQAARAELDKPGIEPIPWDEVKADLGL